MPRWTELPATFDKADTLQSALAKVDSVADGAPVVILASGCRIADNVLTYRILARTARQIGSPIAVVSGNPLWRQLAREHGLPAFGSMSALRRSRHRSILSSAENLVDSLFSSLVPSLVSQGWVSLVAIILFLAAAGGGVYFALPVMKVTIQAPVEQLAQELTIKVDVGATGVDAANGMIPGRSVEHRFTITDYAETTGEKTIGREKARGEATIINSGPGLVLLPAGTILSTDTGVRFSTQAPVAVGPFGADGAAVPTASGSTPPGRNTPTPRPSSSPTPRPTVPGSTTTPAPGGTPAPVATATSGVIARVPVLAVDSGEKGNLPPLALSKVEGEAFRGLTVFNEQALSGGTEEKVRSVSEEDRSQLKEMLFQRAQSQSLSELTVRLRQSESIIPNTMQVRIDQEEYDKNQDDEADRIKGTVSVVAMALAFANQDLNVLAERQWKAAVPQGYRPLAGGVQVSTPEVIEGAVRTAALKLQASGRVERMLEADHLAQSLQGLSVADARARISSMENPPRAAQVEIWPDWAQRAFRIEVQTVQ